MHILKYMDAEKQANETEKKKTTSINEERRNGWLDLRAIDVFYTLSKSWINQNTSDHFRNTISVFIKKNMKTCACSDKVELTVPSFLVRRVMIRIDPCDISAMLEDETIPFISSGKWNLM